MSRFARHFFVCVNERPEGGKPSCGSRGGNEILRALQIELASHPEIWSTVAVTAAGCLGPCFEGPTIVVYPEGTWYSGLKLDDVAELAREHLIGGRPVARLVHRWLDAG